MFTFDNRLQTAFCSDNSKQKLRMVGRQNDGFWNGDYYDVEMDPQIAVAADKKDIVIAYRRRNDTVIDIFRYTPREGWAHFRTAAQSDTSHALLATDEKFFLAWRGLGDQKGQVCWLCGPSPNESSSPDIDHSNWMAKLDGSQLISAFSIPGTHDSATYEFDNIPIPVAQTQTMSILEQLAIGIRYFDIRCDKYDLKKPLHIFHGWAKFADTVEDIFEQMYGWLHDQKTESISVQIKRERRGGSNISDQIFAEEVRKLVIKKKDIWCLDTKLPKLDQVRGKILLLRRYDQGDTEVMGIDLNKWPGEGTNKEQVHYMIQDDFQAGENDPRYSFASALDWKMKKVEKYCSEVVKREGDRLCINFLSYGMGDQFLQVEKVIFTPRDFALGMYEMRGLNDWFRSHIIGRTEMSPERFGMCLFDFPDGGLTEDLIATNKPYA